MIKILLQLTLMVVLFLACWLGLRQINWVKIFHIEEIKTSTEERLGEIFWEMFSSGEYVLKDSTVVDPIDSIITHVCEHNSINKSKIRLHIIRNGEINAFTLPDNHLVVYTGLIKACDNETQLTGVICHEFAHMEKHHIMRRLRNEIGLSVLTSITSGGHGGQATRKALKVLTSTAYDRKMEIEADLTAVDFLIRSEIDPEAYANLMLKLSDNSSNLPDQVYWVSTHPDSKERAKKITDYIKGKEIIKSRILNEETWIKLKEHIEN